MRGRGVLVALCIGTAIGTSACAPATALPSASPSHPAVSKTPFPTPGNQTPALDRLTIAAMRARSYPASTLTTVRTLGNQGGYVNSIVSFVSDGLTEYSLMSVPSGPPPAHGWPVIIINHGYLDPATYRTDDGSYAQFIAAFARAGYVVLKPDYRGHGNSQGVAEGAHLSPVYAYDLLNLVSTVRADSRMDPGRVGLYGHSMGGHEVLRAMVVSRDIRAVVIMAGVVGSMDDIFFSWPHPTQTFTPTAVQSQVAASAVTDYGTPKDNGSFWGQASAINYVADTTAAVQIDQDVADSDVPKVFADHLDSALTTAGKTVEYNLFPGDDHQFIRNRAAVLAAAVSFYRAHL
jgi:dipeptidyl aminopeptidase/acylaminoacyl peptidase